MAFLGQGDFASLSGDLIYASAKTDTEEEVRKGYVAVLKMGLVPFVARTPIRDLLSIEYREKIQPTDVVDPWRFWVFSLSVGGELDHESQTKSQAMWLNASANKITPDMKIRLGLSTYFARDEFRFDEELINDSRGLDFAGLFTKSLGEHWSAGVYVSAGSSRTPISGRKSARPRSSSTTFSRTPSPPGAGLRIMYKVGFDFVRYREETIYDKTKENLTVKRSRPSWRSKSPGARWKPGWRDPITSTTSEKPAGVQRRAAIRILRGLDFVVDLHYERVRDQLSLAKGNRSLEEISSGGKSWPRIITWGLRSA